MSKSLYLKHSTMGGGKTLDCIRTYYNYTEKGLVAHCYKPSVDTRSNKIESRTGDSIDCEIISPNDKIENIIDINCDVILVDEAQFLTKEQVDDLKNIITLKHNIPVICYGLLTNFQTNLFEGSKRLIELADDIERIKSICWCGKKAQQNARIVDDEIVYDGQEVEIGGNESYVPLCYEHYHHGKIRKDM